jgi:uncharacterized protein (DUF433 family)
VRLEAAIGKPCIRGIVEALPAGRTIEQLIANFPHLEEQHMREALALAASLPQRHDVRIMS